MLTFPWTSRGLRKRSLEFLCPCYITGHQNLHTPPGTVAHTSLASCGRPAPQ